VPVTPVILLSVLCSAVAQLLLKKGMSRCACDPAADPAGWLGVLRSVLFDPFVLGGVALHVGALLTWLYVLRHVEVSYAYPFISLGFVLVLVLGHLLYQETLDVNRVLGIAAIVTGIFLVGRSAA
jgi:drug/metabolite transporter (DMT)-like permease